MADGCDGKVVVSMRLLSGKEISSPWPPENLSSLIRAVLESDVAYDVTTVVHLFVGDKELKADDYLPAECPDCINVLLTERSFDEYLYEDLLGYVPDYGDGKYWTDGITVHKRMREDGSRVEYFTEAEATDDH